MTHAASLLKNHLAKGETDHPKSGPLSMKERLCNSIGKGLMGENLAFGNKTGKDAIISLLIDDGIPNRLHRKNLFSDEFTHVGMAMGSHLSYRYNNYFILYYILLLYNIYYLYVCLSI